VKVAVDISSPDFVSNPVPGKARRVDQRRKFGSRSAEATGSYDAVS